MFQDDQGLKVEVGDEASRAKVLSGCRGQAGTGPELSRGEQSRKVVSGKCYMFHTKRGV